MPRVTVSVKTSGGQTIVLTEGDKIVKEVTIECCSPRCASRHGQDKPREVSLIDGQPMPEEGRQWLSLILPESSPQYTPLPPNFCSPSCVRDFLTYAYLPPAARITGDVQKTDIAEYHTAQAPPVTLPEHSGSVLRVVSPANEPEPQADGVGE